MANNGRNPVDGYPIYTDTGMPELGADTTEVAAYAAARGTRLIGTTAQRTAYAYKKKGLRWFDTTNNTEYVHNGTGWEADSALDTGWVTLPLLNSWTRYTSETPKYRVKNGILFMSGRVTSPAGSNDVFAVLPALARHATSTLVFRTHIDNNVAGITVSSDGTLAVFTPTSSIVRSGVSLAPISYPVG